MVSGGVSVLVRATLSDDSGPPEIFCFEGNVVGAWNPTLGSEKCCSFSGVTDHYFL